MRIYLAASWTQKKTMCDVADHLGALGHEVTSHWIRSAEPVGMDGPAVEADEEKAIDGAIRDLLDIDRAQLVAVFTTVESSTGGLHVEYGYAIGQGKPIAIIGPRPNVFYALSRASHYKDAGQFFDWLWEFKED
jgi:hypothetical protein